MDIIQLLPDSVANQIAAGEVVQRPSSVVKELMENAIDAGSSKVDVSVYDAGKTSIQVIDDGKGMSDTDARLAFERHATSKIRKAEDLFTLHTMGFRGEALPSIAAVAQVTLITRTVGNDIGTEVCIHGSRLVSQEPCSCPVGANFEVSNLFYNIPARRKFLKSDKTEMANIAQEFQRIALANPSVAFSLTQDGKCVVSLPESGLLQRIVNLFGRKFKEQLLEIDVETTLIRIHGFVGKPDSACRKKADQYLFVNGRYMKSPYFHKAIMEAFAHLIPDDAQIPYFIYFDIDPANIDVNISPTKTEIKFENESTIWPIIVAAVRDTLGRFNAIPTLDFDVEGKPDIPAFSQADLLEVRAPRIHVDEDFNPFRSTQASRRSDVGQWQSLYSGLDSGNGADLPDCHIEVEGRDDTLFDEASHDMERSSEHFQFRGQYILTSVQSGLMIVDQRRAHIRILYDRYMSMMAERRGASQGLLFPEMFSLPPSDAVLVQHAMDELRNMGFDISPLGGGSYSINGVPSELQGADPVAVLRQIVDTLREKGTAADGDTRHRMALVMARNAAIEVGQALNAREMESLIADLFQCATPNLTPTGQTIVSILKTEQIERMF